jgi:hypothetical protein
MARRAKPKPFDPTTLFDNRMWRFPRPYPTLRASLDAVTSGRKGMELVVVGSTPGDNARVDELVELAQERGLAVVFRRSSIDRWFDVYVVRADQLWRVQAHQALYDAWRDAGGWSDALEAMQSVLLGYDAKQRRAWLADRRQREPGDRGVAIFTLLDDEQKATVEDLGRRCFGPPSMLARLSFFWHVRHPKPNALKRVPRGFTIARAGLAWPVHAKIWPRAVRAVRVIPKPLARQLNAALTTNVQFLTAKGWV